MLHPCVVVRTRLILAISVGLDGGVAHLSGIPRGRGLPVERDIQVRGLPNATGEGFGTTDHGQVRYTQIAVRLHHVVLVERRRKVKNVS